MTYAVLAILMFAPVQAQGPPVPTAQIEAIGKLAWMAGEWEGSGWTEYAPGMKSTFKSQESVELRLNGVALVVEGYHTAEIPGQGEVPVHEAIGMIVYNPYQKAYLFHSKTAAGYGGSYDLVLKEDASVVWKIDTPEGTMRFTIRRDASGRWVEIGERSSGDGAWKEFFGMTLEKVE